MAETETQIEKYTLTSDCVCEIIDDETGETKLDEYDSPVRPETCYGDCWWEQTDTLKHLILDPWLSANGWEVDTPIRVQGTRMNWNSVSGYADTTPEKLVDTLAINGDFTLYFTLNGKELTANRSSHDEPTGSPTFTMVEMSKCETCGDYIELNGSCEYC